MQKINSQHLKVQKVINKLQKQGAYTNIFQRMADMCLQLKIVQDAYRFIADNLKDENEKFKNTNN